MKKNDNVKIASMTRRSALAAGTGMLATPALVGRAMGQETVNWRVQSHWTQSSRSFEDSLGKVASLLAERTDGRFTLELFGSGELASGAEIFELTKRGVVEMSSFSTGYVPGDVPTGLIAAGIPGIFQAEWEYQHFVKNIGFEDLLNEDLAQHGLVCRAEKIYSTELVLAREVTSVDDFRSLKVRSSGGFLEYLSAAGASAQNIPGPELYQSVATGVVDGAHWGAAQGAAALGLYEVAKFHMAPPLGLAMDIYMMRQDKVDQLPDDLRDVLFNILEERFWERTVENKLNEIVARENAISTLGVQVSTFPDDVMAEFRRASQDIVKAQSAKGETAVRAVEILQGFLAQLGRG
ncbi:TRAP transporter substrate-binding protein DctP [Sulfitobacter geojensis]|uniref:TRAP transporter substrate-binding protein DctP n=1 Tax=Sulfitobacter geojensis TaxID=1342299 RepID=UPI00046A1F20|nr:TRAP transporter substrate-binding protein DctP [Sulfitobacter geojensis]KHA54056.1 Twin-arginine translocation pathway signal protein [Sulfitobacter geojensis]NYI29874.1 TRAP-type mannitol/chloroaromatic compound transport system substrate-binding protein [Sulfitobacter geojensis]